MIIPLLLIFTIFPLILSAVGFFLKLSGAIEDETMFYFISGMILFMISITSFTTGIQYQTGGNITTTTYGNEYRYYYSDADLTSVSLISLSVMVTGIFLIISGYSIKKSNKNKKIDDEGQPSW